jgi:alkylation response protein AidB-like acyl-CoA dehydrogenase
VQIYKTPIADIRFNLECFDFQGRVGDLAGFEDYDLETVMAIIEGIGKFCENEFLPLNGPGDKEGVSWDPVTHEVTTPKGFKELYKKYIANGALGLSMDPKYGGGGGPITIAVLMGEIATATNKSFSMCPGLSGGLITALSSHASDALKEQYLPKLISGEWSGTMCLTEPQCGTDLGLLTTKAIPNDDGSYNLTGTKVWITFGEHDLTENIVHLVLARLPDAPEGVKGISAFIVPKFLLDGTRNPVFCTGLEHKLGIHASPTCVISMEDAKGWLVGTPHKGMRSMFVMMNHARLNVGQEGVSFSEIAYQSALSYAKDRRQGRALNPERREEGAKADTILVHPDVRRMLLNIKSTTEGMRGLDIYVTLMLDIAHHHTDEAERQRADDLVALLTPIIKSYCSERGFENVSEAMQVCGGAGYTTDWPIEQYLRDARIAMIYEGTNHIQALDLVGRKLPKGNGRLVRTFLDEIKDFCKANKGNEVMTEFLEPLKDASKLTGEMTMLIGMQGMQDAEWAGATASNYLNVFALTAIAYIWARQVAHAQTLSTKQAATKVKTARYYFKHVLPEVQGLAAIIKAGKAAMMDFDDDEF